MKKLILFEGDIETQGYFSEQMKKELLRLGYDVYLYDLKKPWKSTGEMLRFLEKGNTMLLSFNFHGMCQEPQFLDENGTYIWDALDVKCCNILADHPYYYYKLLAQRPRNYCQLSIDKNHEAFMRRFFPEIELGPFLPTAGTEMLCKLWGERTTDILFTGTYVCPSHFDVFINRNGEEYSQFYHSIIDEVLSDPHALLEDVARRRLTEEIPEATEDELRETLGHIQFLDYYIRFTLRGNVVAALADAGLKVHIIGAGWENLPCSHPENLILSPYASSEECLLALADAKLALNVLPCFHAGAHDRIFNTMLAGAVCVTDSNPYLDQILIDEENVILYDRERPGELADRLHVLLQPQMDEKLQKIAKAGRELAMAGHTWEVRTKILEEIL